MSGMNPIVIDVLTLLVSVALALFSLRWQKASDPKAGRLPVLICAGLLMGLLVTRLGLFSVGGSHGSVWRSPGFHLFLGWLMLSLLPWLIALFLHKDRRSQAGSFFARLGSPWLVALVWLHGVFFNPPNNWAILDNYGFFGFWFKPHQTPRLAENAGLMVLLCLPALVLAYRSWLRRESKTLAPGGGWVRPFFAHSLMALAALMLRPIPDAFMDTASHMSYLFRDPGPDLRSVGLGAPLCGPAGAWHATGRVSSPGGRRSTGAREGQEVTFGRGAPCGPARPGR